MTTPASKIILPLPRPQYVALPEGFITSLAWKCFALEEDKNQSGKKIGLRFRGSPQETKRLEYRITEPKGEKLTSFGDTVSAEGLNTMLPSSDLGEAVINSVLGIKADKGKFQPASPLSPAWAMMQNMSGIQGSENPPDLAEILETIFELGRMDSNYSSDVDSVASLWLNAMELRLANDNLVSVLDEAADKSIFSNKRLQISPSVTSKAVGWENLFPESPFVWFRKAWETITNEEWVLALPARVWVDWATTILRQGFAMAYLFEVTWYDSLARSVLKSSDGNWESIRSDMDDWFPWKPSNSGIEIRDVSSNLKWKSHRGVEIREIFQEWLKETNSHDIDFVKAHELMHEDKILKQKLASALGSRREKGQNLWEAIRYSLITRETQGPYADHFGLLKSRGSRFLIADPGTEWITVLSSLTCSRPSSATNVGEVSDNLRLLGACPEPHDLIQLLERAGLARGSADADQGVSVETAY